MASSGNEYLTGEEVRERLRELAARDGQKALAQRAGVSPAFVGDVVNGRRAPTGALLPLVGVRYPGRLYVVDGPEAER